METRETPLSYEDDYGFPSDEELTASADAVFVMLDEEEHLMNLTEEP
jgi:hypothetical protein